MSDETNRTQLTADIVAAYVENNDVPVQDLPELIRIVHKALCAAGAPAAAPAPATRTTVAQIRRSITPDALISFEDGKPHKQLKRHLIGIASAFPSGPDATARRGIDKTNWIRMEQAFYDTCIDPKDYVERMNLSIRMQNRRFTRLTNGFSKKLDNHVHALALPTFHPSDQRAPSRNGR